MLFPFENIREPQRLFIDDIETALKTKRHLIAHAPSGLGKTAATLSPALQYALDNEKTVFFLTPKHTQHVIAIETLRKINKKYSLDFKVTDIIGKKWLCGVDSIEDMTTQEFGDYCKIMKKEERCTFYNKTRTKEKILTPEAKIILERMRGFFHAEDVKDLADNLCAYEIIIESAKKSDVIIADYYHIFSNARNSILFRMKKELKDCIIIVDEGHNLPDRIRSLNSQRITTFSIAAAMNEAKAFGDEQSFNIINKVGKLLDRQDNECFVSREDFISAIGENFSKAVEAVFLLGERVYEENRKTAAGHIARFLDLWGVNEPGFARIFRKGFTRAGKPYNSLMIRCLDPSRFSHDIFDESHTSILMSGTLVPCEMYRDVLGFEKERTSIKMYESPFPRDNRVNIFVSDATTKYSKRTEENYSRIANHVVACCKSIPGNCAVFFPSYDIMNKVHSISKGRISKKIFIEERNAGKKERRKIIDSFVAYADIGAVLFGVQAGSFAEGIDMPGKFLNGVIVVGIPLDRPDLEKKALIEYYDLKYRRGWDYGYIFPAMVRCLQAAGRCIRTETDKGTCIFIDERFLWENYRKVFPSDIKIKITNNPEEEIVKFWYKHSLV